MLYERPCRFSAEDPDKLWILLAGRQLSHAEMTRWQRVLSGNRRLFPVLSVLLIGIFILEAFGTLSTAGLYWFEVLVTVLLLLLCAVAVIVALCGVLKYPRIAALQRYEVYAADAVQHTVGTRIAFLGDRITVTSLRGTRVLRFADVVSCVETVDGLALSDGRDWIILRAQDLIAFDAQLIREYLAERLEPQVMCVRSTMQALLREPLPIPQIPEAAPCLAEAQLVYETSAFYRKRYRKKRYLLMATALPLLMIAGVLCALLVDVTPWFLVDLVIFIAGCIAVGVIFAAGVFARFRPKTTGEPLVLRFEPDGLTITAEGVTQFCIKERIYLTAESTGVRVHFMNRETLFIPFSATDTPTVLQALAGVPETPDNRE